MKPPFYDAAKVMAVSAVGLEIARRGLGLGLESESEARIEFVILPEVCDPIREAAVTLRI